MPFHFLARSPERCFAPAGVDLAEVFASEPWREPPARPDTRTRAAGEFELIASWPERGGRWGALDALSSTHPAVPCGQARLAREER